MLKFVEDLLQGAPVEWKKLGDIVTVKRGKRLVKKELVRSGNFAVFQNSMTPLGFYNESNVNADTTFIICAGSAGEIGYSHQPFWAADDVCYFMPNDILRSKYLYYVLLNQQNTIKSQVRRAIIPRLPRTVLEDFIIPLPPLPVQEKIVEILDKFTELEAELEARAKQYEYYRNKLLTFGEEVEWRQLGEIGEIRMCKRIMKNQTSASGEIPFYKIGTFGKEADAYISRELFSEYKSKYNYPRAGDILISASGTIGRVVLFDGEDAYFQDSNIVWIENEEKKVLNKYLFYCYQIAKWNISEGGTIQRLYNNDLKKTLIPIPYPNDIERSLSEQARIVSILDKFDTLVNSLTEGLPREIALRHKQYEYYRDVLLTFPRAT